MTSTSDHGVGGAVDSAGTDEAPCRLAHSGCVCDYCLAHYYDPIDEQPARSARGDGDAT